MGGEVSFRVNGHPGGAVNCLGVYSDTGYVVSAGADRIIKVPEEVFLSKKKGVGSKKSRG